MNSAASRQVEMPPMPRDRHVDFGVARELGDHVQRDRLDRRAAVAAVRGLAADVGCGIKRVEIDADDAS